MVRGATDQEGHGAKEGTEASILDPPSVPVSCFTARPFNFGEHYSSPSSRDLFAVGIDCLSVRRHFMASIYKNDPLLCGTTEAVIWPESRSAILQSPDADYPAPHSSFGAH